MTFLNNLAEKFLKFPYKSVYNFDECQIRFKNLKAKKKNNFTNSDINMCRLADSFNSSLMPGYLNSMIKGNKPVKLMPKRSSTSYLNLY